MGYLRRYSYYAVSRSYNPFYYSAIVNPATQQYNLSVLNDGSATSVGTVGTEYLGYAEDPKVVDSDYKIKKIRKMYPLLYNNKEVYLNDSHFVTIQ